MRSAASWENETLRSESLAGALCTPEYAFVAMNYKVGPFEHDSMSEVGVQAVS